MTTSLTNAVRLRTLLIASDLTGLAVAGFAGSFLQWLYLGPGSARFGQIWFDAGATTRLALLAVLAMAAIGAFWHFGHYTKRRPFWDEIHEALKVMAFLAILDASLLYLSKLQFSRFWFLSMWGFALLTIPLARSLLKDALIARGIWQKPTIIVGVGEHAKDTVLALNGEPMLGLSPVALVRASQEEPPVPDETIAIAGTQIPVKPLSYLQEDAFRDWGEASLVVALDQDEFANEAATIQRLQLRYTDVRVVPPLKGLPLFGARVHHLWRHELFFLTLGNNLQRRAPRIVKRAFDFVASITLIVFLSPLFFFFIVKVRQDGGPAFFSHQRIGLDGKPFSCYKFRTMLPNAAERLADLLERDPEARREWEQDFKLKNDPRITPIGARLRRTSLDELPQLWNVMIGQMSLVGPRPIVAAELERYSTDADYYLFVRPGMTGLWQVSGRNDTDYQYRVYLDSWYVKNWSLWYDIVILIKTVRVVLGKQGAY